MTHAREGVVFREDGYARAISIARGGAEGGLHSGDPSLDGVTSCRHELAQPGTRLVLLKAELRVVVDTAREDPERFGVRVDLGIDGGRHLRSKRHG
jgi:hypothetical protein